MGDRSKASPRKSVEQELVESEARYRALAESSPLAVFVVRNGEVLLANPACVKLFGASSPDELLGKSALDLFDHDSQSLVRERMLVGNETVPSVEVRIARLDGTIVDVEAAASPYLDQDVTAIQVVLHDITERKQAAQVLAESEARYRLLTETSALGIVVCRNDPHDDAVLVVNPASVKLFGVSSPYDLIGKSLLSLFAPDSQHVVRQFLDAASGEAIPSVDAQITRVDLAAVDVSITASPMLQDGLAAFNIVLQDVSEAKLLAAQAAQLAVIVQSSPNAIIIKGLDEVITSWNPAAEVLYGYTADEMIGCTVEVLMPPGHVGEPLELIDRIVAGHPVERYEAQRLRKDGRVMDVALTLSAVRDEMGGVFAIVVMTEDITERKRAETEIRRLNAELEQRVLDRTAQLDAANKELEAFTYSVSHDLRAPLRYISGFSSLLSERVGGSLDEKSRHYVDTISRSVHDMGVLIDDLLQFSRSGRAELQVTDVDMGQALSEALEPLRLETADRDIEWSVGPLPHVVGDHGLLRQVWTNLVGNAVKFSRGKPTARIEIGVMDRDDESPHGAPTEDVFYVRDNGAGFDMQYAHKLFGVFQRLHSAAEFEGTGIGLANVRRIVNKLGGRVWAEAELDNGATFYFALPRRKGSPS